MSADGVRYISIAPPEGDCGGCVAIKSTRAFCEKCRNGRPYTWCLGRGWRTKEGRWVRCCNQPTSSAKGEET